MNPASSAVPDPGLEEAFRAHQRFLWGLSYRMTGSAADADDVVQETFVRALEHAPQRTGEPLRPWLARVALNLGRDLLRRRRRRAYRGPWLPAPIETGDEDFAEGTPAAGSPTESRYEMMESVTFAFLLALEVLTPQQRAVLVLRDVFDYSVREAASVLGLSEPNVKTTHHRARRAMEAYDRQRQPMTRRREGTRQAMEKFLTALLRQDVPAVEALLTEDARALNDSDGEFHAARVPLIGAGRVARFHAKIAGMRAAGAHLEVRSINGLPALVGDFGSGRPGDPPRAVITIDVAASGRIRGVYSVVSTAKLAAVRF